MPVYRRGAETQSLCPPLRLCVSAVNIQALVNLIQNPPNPIHHLSQVHVLVGQILLLCAHP